MKNNIWLALIVLFLIPCLSPAQNFYYQPESVTFDTLTLSYYISNWGNGNIIEIDSNGFVSLFNTDYLVTAGGMVIVENILYVCSSAGPHEGLVGFDLADGSVVFQIAFNEMSLVNDVTADTSGFLYATDTDANSIFKVNISEETYTVLALTPLTQPNGILYDKFHHRLLVCYNGVSSPLHACDPDDGSFSVVVGSTMGSCDGLADDNFGNIYLSSWGTGRVVCYDSAFSTVPVTVASGYGGCADIYYNKKHDILAIPDIFENIVDFISVYVDFGADTLYGWPPLEVNFEATSQNPVSEWIWDFGDGDSSFIQSPGHVFDEPGRYDVTVSVDVDLTDTVSYTRFKYITVLADTLSGKDIDGGDDTTLSLPVYVTNLIPLTRLTVPVEYGGPVELAYQGYTLEGCRTGDFEAITYINYDAGNKRFTLDFEAGSTTYLLPGTGPVIFLNFEIISPVDDTGEVTLIDMDGYGSYYPNFYGFSYGDFEFTPILNNGSITFVETGCCIGETGNADCAGPVEDQEEPDIADIVRLIDFLYLTHDPLCCLEEADVDVSGPADPEDPFSAVDIADIVFLIDHLYLSHKALLSCP